MHFLIENYTKKLKNSLSIASRAVPSELRSQAEEMLCDRGEAGLSLRDTTYNRTHASRASEKVIIMQLSLDVKKRT